MLGRSRLDLSSRHGVALLAAALVALGLIGPAVAGAASAGEGPLSAELEALATPAVATQPVPAQAEAVGLPAEGPGSLSREGDRVVVEARFDAGALSQLEALRAAGAKVLVADRRLQTVALSIEPEDLGALAQVAGVSSVTPALRPVVYGAEEAFGTSAIQSNGLCEGGSVISQGVAQLNVPAARASFGARGAGLTVGVISDSFASATTSVEGGPLASNVEGDETTNDLPGGASTCSGQQVPVDVIAEAPASETSAHTDEGRAMLQIVHDVAPHAKLAFATALSSELEFARNIERLAEPVAAGGAGAKVIVDDIGYLSEPFYQDGPVAVAIQKVTENGVTYLTAAGNENLRDPMGRNIGSWEAPAYRPVACPSLVVAKLGPIANACMNFKPSGGSDPTFGLKVANGGTVEVDLQWAEAWLGVKTDLDAYLFTPAGEVLTEFEEGEGDLDSTEVQKPIELLGWKNETGAAQEVLLVINRCSGACNPKATTGTPRLKFEFVGHDGGVTETEYPASSGGDVVGPTIYGHAGSAAAISVAAVKYTESPAAPREPEPYSSRGPVTHYFGPVVGTEAAPALASPEVLAKPDITATDCASTTFFARLEAGAWHFCGTSEAAPHAAAVAALMKQTSPLASPAAIVAAMESSATKFTPASPANSAESVGAGLLDAAGALTALGGSPVDDPPSYVVPSLKEEAAAPPPTVELTKKPAALTNESRPTFEFKASRPVAFTCQIDGAAAQACASPFVVPTALGEGTHGFVVVGIDAQGRSGSTGIYAFTVDTKAPKTTFVKKPKKLLKTNGKKVVGRFRLKASESPVTFYCQVDKEPLRICGKSFRRRFAKGAHVVKVKAKDAAGNLAKKWTAYHFRVKLLRPAKGPGHPPKHHR
jgi:Subtilase family